MTNPKENYLSYKEEIDEGISRVLESGMCIGGTETTSFEEEWLTVELDPQNFRRLSLPILGIVKSPERVQFMVVGQAHSRLEIKNVLLR